MIDTLETYPRINLIHHVSADGAIWGTSNRKILRKQMGGEWKEISRFPFVPPKDILEVSRLTARASRVDQSNLYVNRHGKVLGIRNGTVFRIEEGQPPDPLENIQGDSILRRGFAEDEEGACFFGEYFQNSERGPVRIWKAAPDASRIEVAYEFPAGALRHIHGIHADPHDTGTFWVTVGDDNGECFFYRTNDRFQSMERFGEGNQTWRAVGLLFTPEYLCWITDSHIETNHACRMKRSDGSLEIGQEIDCSGWYSCTTKEGRSVAFTTVEKGPAIRSEEASILISRDGFHWEKVGSYRKDFWRPMKVFKYGVLACPSGDLSIDDFYLSGEGLIGLDGRSARVRIQPEDECKTAQE